MQFIQKHPIYRSVITVATEWLEAQLFYEADPNVL